MVEFYFSKKDGSVRHAFGTTMRSLAKAHTVGGARGYTSMLERYDLPAGYSKIVEVTIKRLLKEGNKEVADAETLLRKRLTEVEKQINDTKLRYAVGKIDDDIYQVAIDR